MTEHSDRYDSGIRVLRAVGGPRYDEPLERIRDIAPDLARFTIEFAYGDVLSNETLDLRTRQLCTVAALAAMGNALPQLSYHIAGALNVEVPPAEILEVILLVAGYAGFPATLNALTAAKAVFAERSIAYSPLETPDGGDRYERGLRALEKVSAGAGTRVIESLRDIAPALARFIVEFAYGDIISRDGLDDRTRELATVALLTALGTAAPQLDVHIRAALNVGATREEIVQAIQQMAVYAGFPAALNGLSVVRVAFAP
jgi:4-carboxymuconolactone decarboxylase